VAPELGREFANLELMPRTVNRRKGVKIGQRQLDHGRRFAAAGLLSSSALARLTAARSLPGIICGSTAASFSGMEALPLGAHRSRN
jgi:hypothetical protein